MATSKDISMEPTVGSLQDDLVCRDQWINHPTSISSSKRILVSDSHVRMNLLQNDAAKEFEEKHKQDLEKVKEMDVEEWVWG